MKSLVIMRGLQGSGKSTRARQLIKSNLNTAVICSADNYFINMQDGEYNFKPAKLGEAHQACRERAHSAMELGIELVIIDNTNTQKWEYDFYVEAAEAFGYTVTFETVGGFTEKDIKEYAKRNVHGCPEEAIRRAAERFEHR